VRREAKILQMQAMPGQHRVELGSKAKTLAGKLAKKLSIIRMS